MLRPWALSLGQHIEGTALKLVAILVLALSLVGCTGSGELNLDELASLFPETSGGPPVDLDPTDGGFVPEDTPRNGPPAGTWSGTISVRAELAVDEQLSGDNGQDPNSVYFHTYTGEHSWHIDVTDTYTVTGEDPESLEYGITGVTLEGEVANVGSETALDRRLWNKKNSGCTWNEDSGSESSTTWSSSGDSASSIEFDEVGTYRLYLGYNPTSDPPTGTLHSWLENSNISANCEEVEDGYDTTDEAGPFIWWATDQYGGWTSDNTQSAVVEERLTDPSSGVVEGSRTWDMYTPEGSTLTVTWSLQHTGPITLPRN